MDRRSLSRLFEIFLLFKKPLINYFFELQIENRVERFFAMKCLI